MTITAGGCVTFPITQGMTIFDCVRSQGITQAFIKKIKFDPLCWRYQVAKGVIYNDFVFRTIPLQLNHSGFQFGNLVCQRNYLVFFFSKFFMEISKNISPFFVSNGTNFSFEREFGHDFYVSSAKVSIQFIFKLCSTLFYR